MLQNNINTIIGLNENLLEILKDFDPNIDLKSIEGLKNLKKLRGNATKNKQNSIKLKENNKVTFFDKNIVRPIRGGNH